MTFTVTVSKGLQELIIPSYRTDSKSIDKLMKGIIFKIWHKLNYFFSKILAVEYTYRCFDSEVGQLFDLWYYYH